MNIGPGMSLNGAGLGNEFSSWKTPSTKELENRGDQDEKTKKKKNSRALIFISLKKEMNA